jgi:hypothetical protein
MLRIFTLLYFIWFHHSDIRVPRLIIELQNQSSLTAYAFHANTLLTVVP